MMKEDEKYNVIILLFILCYENENKLIYLGLDEMNMFLFFECWQEQNRKNVAIKGGFFFYFFGNIKTLKEMDKPLMANLKDMFLS